MRETYSDIKPKSCKLCYFYTKCRCELKKCFYEKEKKHEEPKTKCTDCPYGRDHPCIGWCTKDILAFMKRGCTK